MKIDVPSSNIVIPNESEDDSIQKRKFCPICSDGLIFIDNFRMFKCLNCGYEVKVEDTQPRSQLVSVGTSEAFLVQPTVSKEEERELPKSYRLVKDVSLDEYFVS